MLLALIFILLGVIYLLKNLGIIAGDVWSVVWPSILILVGVWILWKRYKWKIWEERIWKKLE